MCSDNKSDVWIREREKRGREWNGIHTEADD